MKKKNRRKWEFKNKIMFFCSAFFTLIILGFGMLYFHSEIFGITPVKNIAETPKQVKPTIHLLFCNIDDNVSYDLFVDLELKKANVKRLYFDNSVYEISGFNGMKTAAEEIAEPFDAAFVVTETQLAAIIDYVGGVPLEVDKRLAAMCGGISLGKQNLAGITAIHIFENEESNEQLCLTIAEDIFVKWCKAIYKSENFFKLLDLTENDASFTDYIKISADFVDISY